MTEWILPYNEKRIKFRVNDALHDLDRIEWAQTIKNIDVGDSAYLYQAIPVQAIRWKCMVTDVGREKKMIDDSAYSDSGEVENPPYLELERICEYPHWELFSLGHLKKHGYRGNMQSPSKVMSYGSALAEYIHETDELQNSEEKLTELLQKMPMQELKKLAEKYSEKHPILNEAKTKQYGRNRIVAAHAKRRAGGCCELCGMKAPFLDKYGNPYLESHHVEWLSDGGADSIDNVVALCPNCHRKMHEVPEPADVRRLKEVLGKGSFGSI